MSHHHADFSADTLGGRISLAREFAGLSVTQAAQALGVLTSSWAAWECDRAELRANRLTTMAGILGVSPIWLLTGFGNEPREHNSRDSAQLLRELHNTSESIATLNRRVQQLIVGFEGLRTMEGGSAAA
ncbi:MAG: transcriptional regulator [Aquamicrobium sp.]|uniref:transcriptional regulator n=1 Tax=Mesorhizobium sp. Pch-S TaxID=2082387 RepID=UPI001A9310A4|nr:transcriptional regulator [Mesorhizobium sp. Pch-S]MBR2689808.1 transcriptional regulator [Aquamicrobium sp.]